MTKKPNMSLLVVAQLLAFAAGALAEQPINVSFDGGPGCGSIDMQDLHKLLTKAGNDGSKNIVGLPVLPDLKGVHAPIDLAGRTYSRTFKANPLGASHEVEFTHRIEFHKDGTATDNGSTFFGNPPETGQYKIEGETVVIFLGKAPGAPYRQKYTLSDDGFSLTGEAGAVLTISLSGKTYSRTWKTQPVGAPHPVDFTHSVEFHADGTATDNGASFFGNPAETGKYKLEGDKITISLDHNHNPDHAYEQKYTLSADLKSLTNGAGAVLTVK